jgi:hypothetical protein
VGRRHPDALVALGVNFCRAEPDYSCDDDADALKHRGDQQGDQRNLQRPDPSSASSRALSTTLGGLLERIPRRLRGQGGAVGADHDSPVGVPPGDHLSHDDLRTRCM